MTPDWDVQALREFFRDRGWAIHMDDRPGQPIDPFPVLVARGVGTSAAHQPDEPHRYRIECEVCGQKGVIRLSVDPERALADLATEDSESA